MDDGFQEVLDALEAEMRIKRPYKLVRDEEKISEIEKIMNCLKEIIEYDNIEMKIDTPFLGSVDILITGKNIHVLEPKSFIQLIEHSDVIEIVTNKDNVCFNITYYGTSKKVGDSVG